ncbi:MAG TPA: type II secretion system protein [Candidatus Eisenbacteria bacterium]|nr:type II secretion system protein [Candidatus Eisenbacteria bacterium]
MSARQLIKNQKGFTLIELLVVIGILAILLAITLIAINPAHQFAQANNTKRRSDVLQILNVIGQYAAEHKGNVPTDVANATAAGKTFNSTNFPTICADIVSGTPAYIPALPKDPSIAGTDIDKAACDAQATTPWNTGYTVAYGADKRVTVSVTGDEGVPITVTR